MAGTLDDLAALSGVSRATVSRVINGGSVSEATRDRVMAVLERTGYRPNLAARTLASGRSGVVGVVMHVESRELFQDPYFSQLLQGMSDALSETATGMMLWLGNRSKQETLDQILGMGLLEGVIVTAYNQEDPLVDGLLTSSLPTVLVGHRRADRSASYVDVDHVQAADSVTSHLVDAGRHRIGHITGRRGTVAGEDRITGYERAMKRAGLSTDELIVDGDFRKASGASRGHRTARPRCGRHLLRERRDRGGRAGEHPRSRTSRARRRGPRGLRRLGFHGDDGSSADHGPAGDPGTRGRSRPHALTAPGRSRRRSASGDPTDGAGHPAFDRGRHAGSMTGDRERRGDVKRADGLISYLHANVQGSASAREGASRAST